MPPRMSFRSFCDLLLITTLAFLNSSKSYQLLYRSIQPRHFPSITTEGYAECIGTTALLRNSYNNRYHRLNARNRMFSLKMSLNQNSSHPNDDRITLPDGHLYVPKGTPSHRLSSTTVNHSS